MHEKSITSISSKNSEETDIEDRGRNSSSTMEILKYISLLTLTLQKAILDISMRYSRTRGGDMFFEGTAVLMAEVVKLITCIVLVYHSRDEGGKDL